MSNYNDHFNKMKKNKTSKPQQKRLSMDYRSNKPQVKNRSLVGWGLVLSLAFVAGGYGFFYPEDISYVLDHVNVSFLSQSLASDAVKPAETKEAKAENKDNNVEKEKTEKSKRKPDAVKGNANYIEHLIEKEDQLSAKEKKLVEMEEKLQKEKDELQKKIDELEAARKEIATRLDKRVVEDEESINKLVGVYSNMKPQNAAMIISKLDESLAVNVLKKMKKQDAGSILNFIEPAKAKVLSEKYSGY